MNKKFWRAFHLFTILIVGVVQFNIVEFLKIVGCKLIQAGKILVKTHLIYTISQPLIWWASVIFTLYFTDKTIMRTIYRQPK